MENRRMQACLSCRGLLNGPMLSVQPCFMALASRFHRSLFGQLSSSAGFRPMGRAPGTSWQPVSRANSLSRQPLQPELRRLGSAGALWGAHQGEQRAAHSTADVFPVQDLLRSAQLEPMEALKKCLEASASSRPQLRLISQRAQWTERRATWLPLRRTRARPS